jgi:uncharacterized protein (TIGR02145 family)
MKQKFLLFALMGIMAGAVSSCTDKKEDDPTANIPDISTLQVQGTIYKLAKSTSKSWSQDRTTSLTISDEGDNFPSTSREIPRYIVLNTDKTASLFRVKWDGKVEEGETGFKHGDVVLIKDDDNSWSEQNGTITLSLWNKEKLNYINYPSGVDVNDVKITINAATIVWWEKGYVKNPSIGDFTYSYGKVSKIDPNVKASVDGNNNENPDGGNGNNNNNNNNDALTATAGTVYRLTRLQDPSENIDQTFESNGYANYTEGAPVYVTLGVDNFFYFFQRTNNTSAVVTIGGLNFVKRNMGTWGMQGEKAAITFDYGSDGKETYISGEAQDGQTYTVTPNSFVVEDVYEGQTFRATYEVVSSTGNEGKTLSVNQSTISAGTTSTGYTINVSGDVAWRVTNTESDDVVRNGVWYTINTMSGSGNGSFTVTPKDNKIAVTRSVTLTISAGWQTKQVTLNQAAGSIAVPANGVAIGGVIWAKSNLDETKTFATTPGSPGKLYTWGYTKAWPLTGTVTGWPTTWMPEYFMEDPNTVYIWKGKGMPSPAGWRIPAASEFLALVRYSPSRTVAASSNNWNTAGVWVGPDALTATSANSGKAIFFPATDQRTSTGYVANERDMCQYWCIDASAGNLTDKAMTVYTYTHYTDGHTDWQSVAMDKKYGLPVRCVLDLDNEYQ